MRKWILVAILLIAFLLRFNNSNWDENAHLHPDERFLTMVASDMKIPDFFVYGTLPLNLNKRLAVLLNKDNYNDFTVLGRQLSALFDLLVAVVVYKTVEILEKKYRLAPSIKYWASFLYAIAVYPIQSAHFFAVDTFLNFFMLTSFYFALRKKTILSAVFFGLAAASKVSAVFILPLILFALFKPSWKQILWTMGLFLLAAYITTHLASPNYFQSSNLFNSTLNVNFINSLKQLKSFEGSNIWYPPGVQWINRPISFVITNLALVGVGLPYFILIVLGTVSVILNGAKDLAKRKLNIQAVILFWVVAYLLYLSFQFVKSIRYTIFLYPFFALFAALGVNVILGEIKGLAKRMIKGTIIVLVLIWPLLFSSIYLHKNTRVEASEWIYKNLPNGSYILSEYWDDPLPLSIGQTYNKSFLGEQIGVFDPDTPEKWTKMSEAMNRADYYILSSNRGWGSIKRAPQKYPQTSQFYKDLLEGKNGQYKKIKEFEPYYYRFVKFPEDWVEESFTVYDHPTVLIFARNK